MREIELPISDRRKVRDILPLELKGETAVDTDELVFDALSLHKRQIPGYLVQKERSRRDNPAPD